MATEPSRPRRPASPGAERPLPPAAGIAAFRAEILAWYGANRRDFPWRQTRDPWAILVSEVMLQQTQTSRVLAKYPPFLEAFPRPEALAAAPVAALLALWSGLGYNRRALALRASAAAISERHRGQVPDDENDLRALPGIGPYTARAVLAFAWDRPVILIETNIRAVLIDRFFPGEEKIPDRRLEPLLAAALDPKDPRSWYYALMDYGVALKKKGSNPGRRSAAYARQSPFPDSHRRLRGQILKTLAPGPLSPDHLAHNLPFARERIDTALAELVAEGFLETYGAQLGLAGLNPRPPRP